MEGLFVKLILLLLIIVMGMENSVSVSLEDGSSGSDPADNNGLTNHGNTLSRSSINNSSAVKVRPTRPKNSKYSCMYACH